MNAVETKRLIKLLEREILHCNKSASTAPDPYGAAFIVAGAVLTHLVAELRALTVTPPVEQLGKAYERH